MFMKYSSSNIYISSEVWHYIQYETSLEVQVEKYKQISLFARFPTQLYVCLFKIMQENDFFWSRSTLNCFLFRIQSWFEFYLSIVIIQVVINIFPYSFLDSSYRI